MTHTFFKILDPFQDRFSRQICTFLILRANDNELSIAELLIDFSIGKSSVFPRKILWIFHDKVFRFFTGHFSNSPQEIIRISKWDFLHVFQGQFFRFSIGNSSDFSQAFLQNFREIWFGFRVTWTPPSVNERIAFSGVRLNKPFATNRMQPAVTDNKVHFIYCRKEVSSPI